MIYDLRFTIFPLPVITGDCFAKARNDEFLQIGEDEGQRPLSNSVGQRPTKWSPLHISPERAQADNTMLTPFQGFGRAGVIFTGRCPVLLLIRLSAFKTPIIISLFDKPKGASPPRHCETPINLRFIGKGNDDGSSK
jgi:hypothetical protein